MKRINEYIRPKKCIKLINDFWQGSGYPKFSTQNWAIIDDAIVYAYRKLNEKEEMSK